MTRSKSKYPPQSTDNGPRDRIIDSYLESIENSIRDNRPQIKLINYGTGSGKTHQLFQAVCESIRKYPDKQIIGIYVAPLREHLRVPEIIEAQYQDIPIYPINSLEMKTSDGAIVVLADAEHHGAPVNTADHMPAQKKRQPAEHPPLGYRLCRQIIAQKLRHPLVPGHRALLVSRPLPSYHAALPKPKVCR